MREMGREASLWSGVTAVLRFQKNRQGREDL